MLSENLRNDLCPPYGLESEDHDCPGDGDDADCGEEHNGSGEIQGEERPLPRVDRREKEQPGHGGNQSLLPGDQWASHDPQSEKSDGSEDKSRSGA